MLNYIFSLSFILINRGYISIVSICSYYATVYFAKHWTILINFNDVEE